MGIFDGRRRFRTTQDGSKLFFPWFSRGSGYVMASEHDYERLRRQIKVYEIVSFVVIVSLSLTASFLISKELIVTIVATCIGISFSNLFFSLWMRYLLPRLKVTDEKLPRQSFSAWLKGLKPIGPWTVPDPPVTPARKNSD